VSVFVPADATCPHCQTTFHADLAISLQIRRVPEARQRILNGTFNQFMCPRCEKQVSIDAPLMYTDFERMEALAILPDRALVWRDDLVPFFERMFHNNLEVAAPPLVKAWAPQLRRRVVFGLPQAREKLLAWDAGLDDTRVEWIKLRILLDRDLMRHVRAGVGLLLEGLQDEMLDFAWTFAPGRDGMAVARGFRIPATEYRVYADLDPPQEFAGLLVDWRTLFFPSAPLPDEERGPLPRVEGPAVIPDA
jgi:hypothetical protein